MDILAHLLGAFLAFLAIPVILVVGILAAVWLTIINVFFYGLLIGLAKSLYGGFRARYNTPRC